MKTTILLLTLPFLVSCQALRNPDVQEAALGLGLQALQLAAEIEADKRAAEEFEIMKEQEGFGTK
jgi:hypothetical protein